MTKCWTARNLEIALEDPSTTFELGYRNFNHSIASNDTISNNAIENC